MLKQIINSLVRPTTFKTCSKHFTSYAAKISSSATTVIAYKLIT